MTIFVFLLRYHDGSIYCCDFFLIKNIHSLVRYFVHVCGIKTVSGVFFGCSCKVSVEKKCFLYVLEEYVSWINVFNLNLTNFWVDFGQSYKQNGQILIGER